jgi:anthranilate synthase component 2
VKILLIDNFDSFTFNLCHYLEGLGAEIMVIRENKYHIEMLTGIDKIVLSPGSGLPKDSKGMMNCIKDSYGRIPIFGVCLGMQALVEFNGGKLFNQKQVKHGVQEYINRIGESSLLNNVSNRFQAGLYHSWAVEIQEDSEIVVTSSSDSGIIMSIESKNRMLYGVQFHPESIMTPEGKLILKNFLEQ